MRKNRHVKWWFHTLSRSVRSLNRRKELMKMLFPNKLITYNESVISKIPKALLEGNPRREHPVSSKQDSPRYQFGISFS